MNDSYSYLKAFRHPDILQSIRDGKPSRPMHVDLILSDLCQQSCKFCLTESSNVDTLEGAKSIADIKAGDLVWGPDGELQRVTETSSRECEEIFRICIDGRIIEASAEHPILTAGGWKRAEHIRVGDTTAVRLRMRSTAQVESAMEEMGKVHLRTSPHTNGNSTRITNGDVAQEKRQHTAFLPMWVRGVSQHKELRSTWEMGGLHREPSECWQAGIAVSGRKRAYVSADAFTQSNEAARDSRQSWSKNKGKNTEQVTGRIEKYSSSSAQAHVVGQKPDAQPREASRDRYQMATALSFKNGIAIRGSVQGKRITASKNRRRFSLDREEEPRFPRHRAEESNRVDTEGMLCRGEKTAQLDELWHSPSRALPQEAVGLPCSIREGSGYTSASDDEVNSGLRIAGITLERGLGLRQVDSVVRVKSTRMVYNFTCLPGHAYEANGIVVHNCSYRMEGYQANQMFDDKRMMTAEKAYEILEDCRDLGVKGIVFQGGGEPTVHYRFPEIFSRACDYGTEGVKVGLISNGVRINQELAMTVVRAAWVRISVDAATEKTYCSIRRVHSSHWAKSRQGIRNLREQRDKQKTDCVIGVGFVVTPDNWREVADAARMAKDLGADNFRISAQFSNEDEKLFEGFHAEAAQLAKDAEGLTDEHFTVYNRFSDRLEDLSLKNPEDKLCGYQFFTTYIGADLNVYRCCGYAYNERGLVGSLKTQRFKDFWMSQERFDNQANFDGRGCERCQFRKINQTLAYVLDPKPQLHEEFV